MLEMTNRKRNIHTLLLPFLATLCGVVLFGACQQQRAEVDFNETTGAVSGEAPKTITVNVEIERPEVTNLAGTRMNYEDVITNGNYDGVKFVFKEGDLVDVHTYFWVQQSKEPESQGIRKVAKVAKMKITGMTKDKRYYTGTFTVEVPEGIDITESEGTTLADPRKKIFIKGAIGVERIDEDGYAIISQSGQEVDYGENSDYVIPMHFGYRLIQNWIDPATQQKVYGLKEMYFKLVGSIIDVKVSSELADPYEVREIVMQTGAFQSNGKLKFPHHDYLYNDLTGTPMLFAEFVSSEDDQSYQHFPVKGGKKITSGTFGEDGYYKPNAQLGETHYYLWVMPTKNPTNTPKTIKMWVRDTSAPSDPYNPATTASNPYPDGKYFQIPVKAEIPIKQIFRLPSVTVKGDLIISKVGYYLYYGKQGYTIQLDDYGDEVANGWSVYNQPHVAWEFYNPTTKPLKLDDYWLVRHLTTTNMGYPNNVMATKLLSSELKVVANNTPFQDPNNLMLPPGGRMVIAHNRLYYNTWYEHNCFLEHKGETVFDARSFMYRGIPSENLKLQNTIFASIDINKLGDHSADFPWYNNDAIIDKGSNKPKEGKYWYTFIPFAVLTLNKGGAEDAKIIDSYFRGIGTGSDGAKPQFTLETHRGVAVRKKEATTPRRFSYLFSGADASKNDWTFYPEGDQDPKTHWGKK